jgi:hypothetical protein
VFVGYTAKSAKLKGKSRCWTGFTEKFATPSPTLPLEKGKGERTFRLIDLQIVA